MAHIINKARIKQRSLVITLLDLKNAFGEVHRSLIQSVLAYHHITNHINNIIKRLFTGFKSTFISYTCWPWSITGWPSQPLLFNMCFNTYIQHIKYEKYRQFGFSLQLINPIHWFQFVNDAAVITGQESGNQHLLNRFTIWCQWSNMFIGVE